MYLTQIPQCLQNIAMSFPSFYLIFSKCFTINTTIPPQPPDLIGAYLNIPQEDGSACLEEALNERADQTIPSSFKVKLIGFNSEI